ncbi:MAG: hypothetical protein ACFE8A_01875 [Candidatus Hodarchaeota archaeon]
MKRKEYLPFALITLFIMALNTVLAILYYLNLLISLRIIQFLFLFELFVSFGIIISGVLIGRIKSLFLYYIVAFSVLGLFIFALFYFELEYSHVFFRYSKLFYLLIWILISLLSLFFLTLYFFTSFPKKVIALGMPNEHIFFGYLIKIIILVSIPLYILLIIFNHSIGGLILGIFGIITMLILLILIKRAPEKVESVPGIVNFATALGFFYIFMFFHLVMSFSTISTSFLSLIVDMVFLLIIVLFLVQSFTRRISETPTRLKPHEVPIRFQSRLYFTDRLRTIFGERGLVLIIMGIALGYHMAILDSFFKIDIPILPTFFIPNLELITIYHRIFLICSLLTILIAIIVFKSSNRFKEFMVDKYTLKQVFKYIGAFFTRPEAEPSPFELGMLAMGKKIGDKIKSWGNKWQESIKKIIEGKDNSENGSSEK